MKRIVWTLMVGLILCGYSIAQATVGYVSTFAGNGDFGFDGDGRQATSAKL